GAERFVHAGAAQPPPPNPLAGLQGLQAQKLLADIEKSKKQGHASLINALAAAARVDLGGKRLAAEQAHATVAPHLHAVEMGHAPGLALRPQDEAPAGQEGEASDVLAQLVALLRAPRERHFTVQRGPDGRISGVIEVAASDAPQEPRGDLMV